ADEGRRKAPLVYPRSAARNATDSAVRRSRSKCSRAYPSNSESGSEHGACIPVEVEVELGNGRLHDAPHRLPEVGHEPHESERLHVLITHAAEVGAEEYRALRVAELVVDREVREVEE